MLRPGQSVMLCALALLVIGVVMVNSAAMRVDPVEVTTAADAPLPTSVGVTPVSILTSRSTIYMGLAAGAMLLASVLPVRRLAERVEATPWPKFLGEVGWLLAGTLAILCALALVYVPGLGREVNGSARWITLPGLESLQPSEIAKWAIVPLLAWYAARRATSGAVRGGMGEFWRALAPAIICLGAVALMIVKEDLGTGVLVAMVGGIVLLGAGARVWHFLMFVPPAAAAVVLAIWQSPYRVQRIIAFLDPHADPEGSGYHMIQSMATVAGGGVFGRGLGHGLQKFGYLPEDTTDFLFAVICEELGLAGALLVISLYAGIVLASVRIIRRTDLLTLKLVGVGVAATVTIQALINMCVVTGLGPTKGIALPLLSSGGTGWILTAGMLGVLAAIDRAVPEEEGESELVIRARMPREPSRPQIIEPKPEPMAQPMTNPMTQPAIGPVVAKPRVRLAWPKP